jgi:NADH-quinone oxidoreductase subunit G
MHGEEVYRVTARKDQWGEVAIASNGNPGWICNECRFDKKMVSDWVIEGPSNISRHSVISQGHYNKNVHEPQIELLEEVIGKEPIMKMDINKVSEVNKPTRFLSELNGPAHSEDFK